MRNSYLISKYSSIHNQPCRLAEEFYDVVVKQALSVVIRQIDNAFILRDIDTQVICVISSFKDLDDLSFEMKELPFVLFVIPE